MPLWEIWVGELQPYYIFAFNGMVLNYYSFRLQSLLSFYYRAQTRYDIHSPFLSEFVERVVEDRRSFFAFERAESLRRYWLEQTGRVPIVDLGAGSKVNTATERSIAELVRHSAIDAAAGRQLFRLACWRKPRYMVELGTNVGISTLYLHGADRRARLISVEGNPHLARMAAHGLKLARVSDQLQLRTGSFAELLPEICQELPRIDLLFLDGDHRGVTTRRYIEQCMPLLHDESTVVIGDIHWSPDMEAAWHDLKSHPRVRASVDLYHLGLLFFRPEIRHPEHRTIVPAAWKPWHMGFF